MKKLCLHITLLVAFLFYGYITTAQTNKTNDSLLAIALKNNPDSNSVQATQNLQRNFFNAGLYDSAFKYAHHLIAVTKKIKDKEGLAKAYFNLGSIYTNLTYYDSAAHYTKLAENEAIKLKDSFLLVNVYNTFAVQYRYQSDFTTALDYAIKGANIAEQSKDSAIIKLIPSLYSNISNCLTAQNQLLKAIEYGKKALLFTNYPNEKRFRILLQLDVADSYIRLQNFTEAEKYVSGAVAENDMFDNIILDLLTYNLQGYYFDNVDQKSRALVAYREAYKLADSVKNDYLKSEAANNIATLYLLQKDYSKAEFFAEEANKISIRLKHFKIAAFSFATLKNIAAANSNYKLALQYADQQKNYADSATNEASQKQTLSLEKKYESEKKEKEIADLTITNTAQELAVLKRNRFLLIGGITASLLLIILGLLYRNSKQKQLLSKKENVHQQEEIKFLHKQQQVVSLQSMVNGQETERSRIAKDLHDGLGGLFSTIKMYFSTLQHEQESLHQNELFTKSYKLIDTASDEVRRIAHNMMPEGLMKLGLIHALEDMCSNINAARQLQVKLQSYGMGKRMNASTEIMLYRIVQELLNNIIKHAHATKVIVQFNLEANRLTVTVEDNGRGFNLNETDGKKQRGLETIKSRVNYLNGNISIDSENEVGTTILMEFLMNEETYII